MAEIIDDMAELRSIDPALQEKLLDDLKKVDPNHWPALVKRFRSAHEYRQQLLARESGATRLAERPSDDHGHSHSLDSGASAFANDSSTVFANDHEHQSARADQIEALRRATEHALSDALTDQLPLPPVSPSSPLPSFPQGRGSSRQVLPVDHSNELRPSYEGPTDRRPIPREDSPSRPNSLRASSALGPNENNGVVTPATFETDVVASSRRSGTLPPPEFRRGSSHWESTVTTAIEQLGHSLPATAVTPADRDAYAQLRLLQLASGDVEGALAPIPGTTPSQQDAWSKQLFALATQLDAQTHQDPSQRAQLVATQLEQALAAFDALRPLSVNKLTLCKKVRGFGLFDELPLSEVSQGGTITLYAELANYVSESTDKGMRTLLATSYRILDAEGIRVASGDFPEIEDVCLSRRQDFHVQYGIRLPRTIEAGAYSLELTVEDVLGKKRGVSSVRLAITKARR